MRVHGTNRLVRRLLALTTVVALAYLGCTSAGGPTPGVQPIHAAGRYVHAPSGFEFPESFGEFDRGEIKQYEESEANIGVGYNLEQADTQIALTVFVFPPTLDETEAPLSLAKQFEIERANVLQYHPGAIAGATWTPPPTQNRETTRGYAETFHYQQEFAHRRQDAEADSPHLLELLTEHPFSAPPQSGPNRSFSRPPPRARR